MLHYYYHHHHNHNRTGRILGKLFVSVSEGRDLGTRNALQRKVDNSLKRINKSAEPHDKRSAADDTTDDSKRCDRGIIEVDDEKKSNKRRHRNFLGKTYNACCQIETVKCSCFDGQLDPYLNVGVKYEDGFCSLGYSHQIVNGALSAMWNFACSGFVDASIEEVESGRCLLQLAVLDADYLTQLSNLCSSDSRPKVGHAEIPMSEVISAGLVTDRWLKLRHCLMPAGGICVSYEFVPLLLTPTRPSIEKPRFDNIKMDDKMDLTRLLDSSRRRIDDGRVTQRDDVFDDPLEVPYTYFRATDGNIVRLFNDAEVHEHEAPLIDEDENTEREVFSVWRELYEAIEDARHFIYIIGWSVDCLIPLLRVKEDHQFMRNSFQHKRTSSFNGRDDGSEEMTIGEQLKRKGEAGVKVCLLIWDDMTSFDNGVICNDGVMATKDKETRQFFDGCKNVECHLVSRMTGEEIGLFGQLLHQLGFTHHQKSIVLDARPSNDLSSNNLKIRHLKDRHLKIRHLKFRQASLNEYPRDVEESSRRIDESKNDKSSFEKTHPTKRVVRAFWGGLDITSGRYDTPSHRLFSTLKTTHAQDFYNGCIPGM